MAQFPEGSFADEHVCSNVQPYIEMSMSLTGNEWHKHTSFLILKLLFSYNVRLRSKRWFKCTQGERGNETASECEKRSRIGELPFSSFFHSLSTFLHILLTPGAFVFSLAYSIRHPHGKKEKKSLLCRLLQHTLYLQLIQTWRVPNHLWCWLLPRDRHLIALCFQNSFVKRLSLYFQKARGWSHRSWNPNKTKKETMGNAIKNKSFMLSIITLVNKTK